MRVDSPGLDVGDGLLDDLTDLLLASFAASLSSPLGGFLWGVIIPLPI